MELLLWPGDETRPGLDDEVVAPHRGPDVAARASLAPQPDERFLDRGTRVDLGRVRV